MVGCSRELNQRETSHLRLDLITVPSKPTPSLRLLLIIIIIIINEFV